MNSEKQVTLTIEQRLKSVENQCENFHDLMMVAFAVMRKHPEVQKEFEACCKQEYKRKMEIPSEPVILNGARLPHIPGL